ncbi:MAG: vanillate O-demethylase oxidoreductase VanB [Rhizorhabdus sp.]|nr:vanillate O-demethylase oxidoreductase VanB [Rhizorhabdus sp.]
MTDRIVKDIELKAPIDRVWRAITDPAEFGAWFRVKIEGAFVPGQPAKGRVTHPGFEHVVWQVKIVAMDEPGLFSFTWHPYAVDPDFDYSQESPTLVEFRLAPTPGGTHLTVVESGFDAIPADRRPDALRMNEGGWAQQMINIQAHVES